MTQSTSRTDLTGSLPGDPREGGGAPLSGRVVLLPRLKERDRIASALERAGARVLRAAVTRTVPGEAAALEATARRIMAGEAAWLVLTSARTVEALAPYLLAEAGVGSATGGHEPHPEPTAPSSPYRTAPPHTPTTPPMRVAVVGPATAKAWSGLTGASPDLVARGSAAALLEEPALAGGPATGGHTPHQEPGTPDPHDSAASPHAPITPPRQHQPSATIPPMRVAVVGPATAKAWSGLTGSPEASPPPTRDSGSGIGPHGFPDAAGRDDSDGRAHTFGDAPDSPQALPEAARRVLLPASALADPALADGLRRAGWEVEQVAAYTTVTADAHDLPPDLERTWATGGVDAVVLTAPSTTRAVLELLGPPPRGTGLVAIGATTAAAAHELSLPVAATAPSPTPEGVLQATIDAIRGATGSAPAPQEPP
ncbi:MULTISPECIES: uroporphyrinogen-III synthase [Actinomyces]|uniref:uroporphyrinogen-III synthase n=1 Tax=Actinomyces TaxID=1654 RepID=UPI0009D69CEB|nr:uroporphyrinogen-III synthase [Actinomyces oris]